MIIDKSFPALIYSLILHGLFLLVSLWWKPEPQSLTTPLTFEFTIQEDTPQSSQASTFVTDPEQGDEILEQLKDQANYLSRLTRRVEEEMVARDKGPSRNRSNAQSGTDSASHSSTANTNLDLKPRLGGVVGSRPTPHSPDSLKIPQQTADKQGLGKNIVMGGSTVGEHIPGVQEGSFTALNTDQFLYYTFFARVNEQIRYRWVTNTRRFVSGRSPAQINQLARVPRSTQVEIVIDETGHYVSSRVLSSSGDEGLDQAAIQAFIQAAPLNNPPLEMLDEDRLIRLYYGFIIQWQPRHLATGY